MRGRRWVKPTEALAVGLGAWLLFSCSSDNPPRPDGERMAVSTAALSAHAGPSVQPAPCGVTLSATSTNGNPDAPGKDAETTLTLPFPVAFSLPAAIPTSGPAIKGKATLSFSVSGGATVSCKYDLNGGSSFTLSTCSNGDVAGSPEIADTVSLGAQTSNGSKGGTVQLSLTLGQPNAPACTAFSVAAGGAHTCSIREGGAVMCAGYNDYGQLGDGTTTSRYNPVAVPGVPPAIGITAGGAHTCAVTGDGHVWCWGENATGELGDGTTTSRPTPSAVPGITTALAVAAGLDRTCALLANGTVDCWGDNTNGALGDGSTTQRPSPVPVSGLSNVVSLAAGTDHTCALLNDGSVQCWGSNDHGALGDGTTQTRLTPVPVEGLAGPVRAIAAGNQYACALLSAGAVSCWGFNLHGNLGDGTTTDRLQPVQAQGVSNAVALTAGFQHACAALATGNMLCWGDNALGNLGDGTRTARTTPTAVVGLTQAEVVTAGTAHTCAIQGGTSVYCWGDDLNGDLGDGHGNFQVVPVLDSPIPSYEVDITGNPLNIILDYPDAYTTNVTPHAVTGTTPTLNALMTKVLSQPPVGLTGLQGSLTSTPLNSVLDFVWTNTYQGLAAVNIATQVCDNLHSQGKSCAVEQVNLPSNGFLGAISGAPTTGPLNVTPPWGQPPLQKMILTYYLQGASVTFDSDFGTKWVLSFDIALFFSTPYSLLPCQFAPDVPNAHLWNVDTSAGNAAADVAEGLERPTEPARGPACKHLPER